MTTKNKPKKKRTFLKSLLESLAFIFIMGFLIGILTGVGGDGFDALHPLLRISAVMIPTTFLMALLFMKKQGFWKGLVKYLITGIIVIFAFMLVLTYTSESIGDVVAVVLEKGISKIWHAFPGILIIFGIIVIILYIFAVVAVLAVFVSIIFMIINLAVTYLVNKIFDITEDKKETD